MKYKIRQIEPYFDSNELDNLKKVIETGWVTEGPFARTFLKKIQELTKAKYALFSSNGTVALYLALLAVDIRQGDEIIVPDFTFIASATSPVFAGAKPIFADILDSNLNMDPAKIEQLITPNTKAIMPVHMYGQACDMDPIRTIAKTHNLKIIEDAAQSLGVFYKGVHTGILGDVGSISFFADKTITTGEGAVLLTNNESIYKKLTLLTNHGRSRTGTYIHEALGLNFRITDLQCAVGLAQIEKFKEIEKLRLHHYRLYRSLLQDIPEVTFLKESANSNFVPYKANIRVAELKNLIDHLEAKSIQTRRFFYPLHRQPCFSYLHYKEDDFPITNKAYQDGLSLPLYCGLRDEHIRYVCEAIQGFYTH